jgi:uncharacterized protein with PQ loop repeat
MNEMNPLTSKMIFTIGIVLWLIIRIPFQREQQKNTIVDDRKTVQEKVIRFLLLLGILFLPLTYVLGCVAKTFWSCVRKAWN